MTEVIGRRERKKATTRRTIADSAIRLFLAHGYDEVGIRDVATEADVAVTTLFAHFPSKEALVFEADSRFEDELVRAVSQRSPDEPLVPALRRRIRAMVRHCSTPDAAPLWQMIDDTPALREYEASMMVRHADALAEAIARDLGLRRTTIACRAVARFTVDAFALARGADRPMATVDEVFTMIDAAWHSVDTTRR